MSPDSHANTMNDSMCLFVLCASADVNACIQNPCANGGHCSDLPPPALNNAAGRNCTCDAGLEYANNTVGCIGKQRRPHHSRIHGLTLTCVSSPLRACPVLKLLALLTGTGQVLQAATPKAMYPNQRVSWLFLDCPPAALQTSMPAHLLPAAVVLTVLT